MGFGADTLVGWNSWRLKPTLSEPQSSICKMGHLAEVSWMRKPRVLHPQAALRPFSLSQLRVSVGRGGGGGDWGRGYPGPNPGGGGGGGVPEDRGSASESPSTGSGGLRPATQGLTRRGRGRRGALGADSAAGASSARPEPPARLSSRPGAGPAPLPGAVT